MTKLSSIRLQAISLVFEGWARNDNAVVEGVANRLQLSSSSIYQWLQLYEEDGDVEPKRIRLNHNAAIDEDHWQFIAALLDRNPTLYMSELREELFIEFNIFYDDHRLLYALHSHNYTNKVIENQAGLQNQEARAMFRNTLKPERLDGVFPAEYLIFCDETHLAALFLIALRISKLIR